MYTTVENSIADLGTAKLRAVLDLRSYFLRLKLIDVCSLSAGLVHTRNMFRK